MGRSIGKKMKMKQTLFLILVVALITAQTAPAPIDLLSAFLPRPNRQSIKQHGRNKFAVGAALGAVGLISGNQGITNAGFGLAKAGLATKLVAHAFPQQNKKIKRVEFTKAKPTKEEPGENT